MYSHLGKGVSFSILCFSGPFLAFMKSNSILAEKSRYLSGVFSLLSLICNMQTPGINYNSKCKVLGGSNFKPPTVISMRKTDILVGNLPMLFICVVSPKVTEQNER